MIQNLLSIIIFIKNMNQVLNMNIRELASKSHVSTATITRFCHKLNCDGFVDLK